MLRPSPLDAHTRAELATLAQGWDGTLAGDLGGQIVWADHAFHSLLGFKNGSLIGLPLDELLPREVQGIHLRLYRSAIRSNITDRDMEPMGRPIEAVDANGRRITLDSRIRSMNGLGIIRVRLPARTPPDED